MDDGLQKNDERVDESDHVAAIIARGNENIAQLQWIIEQLNILAEKRRRS